MDPEVDARKSNQDRNSVDLINSSLETNRQRVLVLSLKNLSPSQMSEEQLKFFLEKAKTDASIEEKLKTAANVDAVIAIAKEAGFAIAAEDIQSIQSTAELSEDEIEAISGGASPTIYIEVARLTNKLNPVDGPCSI